MSNYEYNKKYAKEWDKKNMKNVGVSLRIEQYEKLTNNIEKKLDEADVAAERSEVRYSASEVFGRVRSRIRESNTV